MVVLARLSRGYAAMAKASSDCEVEKGRLPRRLASQALAISLEELGISRRVLANPLVVAVSGRSHRQNDERHCSGTRAPLPAGR